MRWTSDISQDSMLEHWIVSLQMMEKHSMNLWVTLLSRLSLVGLSGSVLRLSSSAYNMTIFSPKTLKDWQIRGITDVSFFLVSWWCAGEKVLVEEWIWLETDFTQTEDGIHFHTKKDEWEFFEKTRLTKVNEEWIVSNKEWLVWHCSCGSSFQRKTGNPILDKAEQIRLALKKKRKHHH